MSDEAAKSDRSVPVVGFVGRSGSGKTSLLERLIPALQARGLAVGIVKHTSHGFEADRPGKDSFRFYQAGAAAVGLISEDQLATFTRLKASPDDAKHSLDEVLGTLPADLDIVLAEGFSWEAIPRFVVVPGDEECIPEHRALSQVIRLIRVPKPRSGEKSELPAELVESVVDEIMRKIR